MLRKIIQNPQNQNKKENSEKIELANLVPVFTFNPNAQKFSPRKTHVLDSIIFTPSLNPLAKTFAPNVLFVSTLNPHAKEYCPIEIFPEILDISTPNISLVDDSFTGNVDSETLCSDTSCSDVSVSNISCDNESETTDSENDSPHKILQDLRIKNTDKIIIGQLNINSVRNKIGLLADMMTNKIDILLISETKIDQTFPKSQFLIQSYSEPYRLDRTANGGGILLYVRSDIPSTKLPLIDSNIECIILEVTISKKKWLLIGTYNNNKSNIESHLLNLEKSLNHYLSSYDNVVVFGDMNSEIREESMKSFCELYDLRSLIKTPTCFMSTQNPSCIDLFLTNRPRSFQNSQTLETGLSDFHHLAVTVLKTHFRKKPPKMIMYRDYKNYYPPRFQNDLRFALAGIDLNQISNDNYVSLLLGVLERHAPIKMKKTRGNSQPFVTKELRKEHMKRTKLLNKYRKEKNDVNERAYKKQRNKCVKLLKKVKISYYGNLKPANITDNKKFWKMVKPLFSDKVKSADSITLIENNKIVSDDKEVADIFNTFFGNAVKMLNIESYEHFSFDEYFLRTDTENEDPIKRAIEKYADHPSIKKIKEKIPIVSPFSFKETTLKSVMDEIENLNVSKSTPIESIPAKIIKDVKHSVGPKIHIDFNKSVKNGIFPQNLKLADVTPLHKKENRQFTLNYRPVSLLPAMSKIFEKLMKSQINEYMAIKLSIFLCGFTKNMSPQNCLLFMVEKWKKFLDKNMKCGVLLTDLSKAFDCLVHDLFIAKLDAYGFDYLACKLIHSYLVGRMQRVRVNASFSDWCSIDTGVPQGSVLGPDLYNINSNDLFLFLALDIANFADDNSPFVGAQTIPQVISELEEESVRLLNWLRNNGQKANPSKFHLLLSSPGKYSAKIGKFSIENTNSQKLLGNKVDNKVIFDEHVSALCKEASKKLHALSRVSRYMTFKQRKIVMKAFISSQFGYCPLVWICHSRTQNNRINKIHERALRLVYQDEISTFEDLLEKDKSFTIHERNVQGLGIELYKVAWRLAPEITNLVFPVKPTTFVWEDIFQTFNVKTTTWGLQSLSHIAPKVWSNIPKELKLLPLAKFRKAIRKWKPVCPCKICKYIWVQGVGYIAKESIQDGL